MNTDINHKIQQNITYTIQIFNKQTIKKKILMFKQKNISWLKINGRRSRKGENLPISKICSCFGFYERVKFDAGP